MRRAILKSSLWVLVVTAATMLMVLRLAEAGLFKRGRSREPIFFDVADTRPGAARRCCGDRGCSSRMGGRLSLAIRQERDRFMAITQLGFDPDDEWVLISARQLQSGTLMLLFRHPGPGHQEEVSASAAETGFLLRP